MNRYSSHVALPSVFATSGFLCLFGCGGPTAERGPSYAELVTIYNAELQSLDRLERKREELISKTQGGPWTIDRRCYQSDRRTPLVGQ